MLASCHGAATVNSGSAISISRVKVVACAPLPSIAVWFLLDDIYHATVGELCLHLLFPLSNKPADQRLTEANLKFAASYLDANIQRNDILQESMAICACVDGARLPMQVHIGQILKDNDQITLHLQETSSLPLGQETEIPVRVSIDSQSKFQLINGHFQVVLSIAADDICRVIKLPDKQTLFGSQAIKSPPPGSLSARECAIQSTASSEKVSDPERKRRKLASGFSSHILHKSPDSQKHSAMSGYFSDSRNYDICKNLERHSKTLAIGQEPADRDLISFSKASLNSDSSSEELLESSPCSHNKDDVSKNDDSSSESSSAESSPLLSSFDSSLNYTAQDKASNPKDVYKSETFCKKFVPPGSGSRATHRRNARRRRNRLINLLVEHDLLQPDEDHLNYTTKDLLDLKKKLGIPAATFSPQNGSIDAGELADIHNLQRPQHLKYRAQPEHGQKLIELVHPQDILSDYESSSSDTAVESAASKDDDSRVASEATEFRQVVPRKKNNSRDSAYCKSPQNMEERRTTIDFSGRGKIITAVVECLHRPQYLSYRNGLEKRKNELENRKEAATSKSEQQQLHSSHERKNRGQNLIGSCDDTLYDDTYYMSLPKPRQNQYLKKGTAIAFRTIEMDRRTTPKESDWVRAHLSDDYNFDPIKQDAVFEMMLEPEFQHVCMLHPVTFVTQPEIEDSEECGIMCTDGNYDYCQESQDEANSENTRESCGSLDKLEQSKRRRWASWCSLIDIRLL